VDWNCLLSQTRIGAVSHREVQRTPFQRDQDRIVFSAAFRRLQDKTQVHPFPDSDYIRRRLTHSIEVSCVGRSLGTFLAQCLVRQRLTDIDPAQLSFDLGQVTMNACLAHDIGNPPFGHAGEKAIGSFFESSMPLLLLGGLNENQRKDLVKFEGNAQGFRWLTRLQDSRGDGGLRLTCATLAAFTKYPTTSLGTTKEYIGFKKHGYFGDDEGDFTAVASAVGLTKSGLGWRRHPLAYLMEAADDVCYRVIDLEDAFILGRVSYSQVKEIMESIIKQNISYQNGWTENETVSWLRARAIGALIKSICDLMEKNVVSICEGTWTQSLIEAIPTYDAVEASFKLVKERVFNWERTVSAELAGAQMIIDVITRLVNALEKPDIFQNEILLRLLPNYKVDTPLYEKLLLVTDFVSGMTDSYLQRIHRRITGQSIS
jgi:dGTPase